MTERRKAAVRWVLNASLAWRGAVLKCDRLSHPSRDEKMTPREVRRANNALDDLDTAERELLDAVAHADRVLRYRPRRKAAA